MKNIVGEKVPFMGMDALVWEWVIGGDLVQAVMFALLSTCSLLHAVHKKDCVPLFLTVSIVGSLNNNLLLCVYGVVSGILVVTAQFILGQWVGRVKMQPYWDKESEEFGPFKFTDADPRFRMDPESIMTGSTLMSRSKVERPECSAALCVKLDGKYVMVGDAIRIGDSLVTAFHNLNKMDEIYFSSHQEGRMIPLLVHSNGLPNYRVYFHDIAVFQPGTAFWTDTGLKQAKVVDLSNGGVVTAHSVSKGASSYGVCTVDVKNPTMLCYHGSTVPGFSGSGYYMGKALVGIHLAGGSATVNYGVSAALLKMRIQPKPEGGFVSEPEYLRKLYREGKLKGYNVVDDEFVAVYDGRSWRQYALTSFEAAFEGYDEWEDQLDDVRAMADDYGDEYWSRKQARTESDKNPREFDALDVMKPVFRDVPNLDVAPVVTPLVQSPPSALRVGTPANLNFQAGPPKAAELPRVSAEAAKLRVERRDAILTELVGLKSYRASVARQYEDNAMLLARLENEDLRANLVEKSNQLSGQLTQTNLKIRELNTEAEKLKALTPEEKNGKNRKKKGKTMQVASQAREVMEIQNKIAELRKQLKQFAIVGASSSTQVVENAQ